MNLQLFYPSLKLQSYIKCYYLSESDYTDYVKDVFYADGCVEVVFHIGLDFYRDEEKECWAKVIGQITQPLTMKAKGRGRSFGIWFWPHTFSLFSDFSVNVLNDKAIALDNVFNQTFIDFVRNSMHENDIESLVRETNSCLLKKLKVPVNPLKERIAAHAVQYIVNEKNNSNLDKLVSECNISNRYLQKMFLERIGFSPKFFIRITRFQRALHYVVNCQTDSLTNLAHQAGYYDQAHFIREFKEFTGISPSQFRLTGHPINQYFLSL